MIWIQLPWVHSVQQIRIHEEIKWMCRSVTLDHQVLPNGWSQKFLSRHFCSPRGFYLLSIHYLLYRRGDHNTPFTVKSMRQTKTKLLVAFSFIITYLLPLLNSCKAPVALPAEYPRLALAVTITHAGGGTGSEQGSTVNSFLITDGWFISRVCECTDQNYSHLIFPLNTCLTIKEMNIMRGRINSPEKQNITLPAASSALPTCFHVHFWMAQQV